MSTSTSTSTATTGRVDVGAPRRFGIEHVALALAALSLPGSLLPWDWFAGGGLVIGIPLAVAAIVLALRARRRPDAAAGSRLVAAAALVIAVGVLLIPVVWITVSALTG